MVTILDKEDIQQNCESFFDLYDEVKGKARVMCERKIAHTREVAKNSLYIAKALKLSEYDASLSWVIGYLHDFARFGQAVVTQTFKDSDKYNHAHLGAKLLFKYDMIKDIIKNYNEIDEKDKIIMEKAVYHHGDLSLPEDLSKRERLFCEIIREADKIDIFRTVVTVGYETMYGAKKEEIAKTNISPKIEEAFYNHTTANYKERKTYADFLLAHQALFFGLNMDCSKRKVMEDGYLTKMLDIKFLNKNTAKKYQNMRKYLLDIMPKE